MPVLMQLRLLDHKESTAKVNVTQRRLIFCAEVLNYPTGCHSVVSGTFFFFLKNGWKYEPRKVSSDFDPLTIGKLLIGSAFIF